MNYSKMTLKEKVLQTFVVTIREINKHGGPDKFFDKYHVGGMYYNESADSEIMSGEKIEMGTSTSRIRLQQCRKASKQRLFVCADECTVKGQKNVVRLGSVIASKSEKNAYTLGKINGMQMNDNDVDWILGPAIDMNYEQNPTGFAGYETDGDAAMGNRLFRAGVRGIQEQGVCATVKHFPGLGTDHINMHFSPGKNTFDFDKWMNTYGKSYKEMFEEGVMCVMTTHITLRSFSEKKDHGYYPIATYSHDITTKLLKERLGFKGAVVTDALIMGGMATGDLVAETVQAFKAGADFLLWPPVEAADAICEAIENGDIPMSRLDDALSRIEKVRLFREKALSEKHLDKPDVSCADKEAEKLLRSGVEVKKNEIGFLPVSTEKCKNILIVDVTDGEDNPTCAILKESIEKRGVRVDIKRDIYDESSRVCWQEDIDELRSQYDAVIFCVNTELISEWGVSHILIWATHLFNKKNKIIVNFASPFFETEFFPEDPTFIATNSTPCKVIADEISKKIFGE